MHSILNKIRFIRTVLHSLCNIWADSKTLQGNLPRKMPKVMRQFCAAKILTASLELPGNGRIWKFSPQQRATPAITRKTCAKIGKWWYSYQLQNYASSASICSRKINAHTLPPDALKTREWVLRPLKQLLSRMGEWGREANAFARENSKSSRCQADFYLAVLYFCFPNILQMNLIGETSNISVN